jgi:hypothetical protein
MALVDEDAFLAQRRGDSSGRTLTELEPGQDLHGAPLRRVVAATAGW